MGAYFTFWAVFGRWGHIPEKVALCGVVYVCASVAFLPFLVLAASVYASCRFCASSLYLFLAFLEDYEHGLLRFFWALCALLFFGLFLPAANWSFSVFLFLWNSHCLLTSYVLLLFGL